MKQLLRLIVITAAVTLTALSPTAAQNAMRGTNYGLQVREADGIRLPATLNDMTFFDGKLRISSGGMALAAGFDNGMTGFSEIDTLMLAIDPAITYAVRQPSTGNLFFTKPDDKGQLFLYERYEKKPGKYVVQRVRPDKFSYTIEHPIFSPDGKTMVFASNCPLGFGGKDLWYSEIRDGKWQYPRNMGRRINTEGDEVSPAMFGDFLVFSSNGRGDAVGGFDLYVSRLVATHQTGDTVMMYPIGQSPTFSMDYPFCSKGDDYAFTAADGYAGGWWAVSDGSGVKVFQFTGRIDCVALTGTVTDIDGHPVAGATVTMRQGGRTAHKVVCDSTGSYLLLLQPDEECELSFAAKDYLSATRKYMPVRGNEDNLFYNDRQNAALFRFVADSLYGYGDLFGSSVSVDLTPAGRSRLEVMVRYLVENPHLQCHAVSVFSGSGDITFCNMINKSRLSTIVDYFVAKGIAADRIQTSTSLPRRANNPAADGSQTVFFYFSK